MKVTGTFNIRRYWFKLDTPREVLASLNYRLGNWQGFERNPYVDVNYYGDTDRVITVMELRYSQWVLARELLTYTVEGDDGL